MILKYFCSYCLYNRVRKSYHGGSKSVNWKCSCNSLMDMPDLLWLLSPWEGHDLLFLDNSKRNHTQFPTSRGTIPWDGPSAYEKWTPFWMVDWWVIINAIYPPWPLCSVGSSREATCLLGIAYYWGRSPGVEWYNVCTLWLATHASGLSSLGWSHGFGDSQK